MESSAGGRSALSLLNNQVLLNTLQGHALATAHIGRDTKSDNILHSLCNLWGAFNWSHHSISLKAPIFFLWNSSRLQVSIDYVICLMMLHLTILLILYSIANFSGAFKYT